MPFTAAGNSEKITMLHRKHFVIPFFVIFFSDILILRLHYFSLIHAIVTPTLDKWNIIEMKGVPS